MVTISQMEKDELITQAETLREIYMSWALRDDTHPLALQREGTPLQGVAQAVVGALTVALGSKQQALLSWSFVISDDVSIPHAVEYVTEILCQKCKEHGPQLVVNDEYHEGFAGGTIAVFHLECGHTITDESDDVNAAR